MDLRPQWISLWLVPVFGAIMALAFVAFPGFWPPMPPSMTAVQVADFYAQHTASIRFSMVTFNLCAIMLIPFFMTIAVQIKRMSLPSHVLAYSYLGAAATGATLFAIADVFWLIAAYRPGRDPHLVLLLNDMAWLVFTAPVGAVVVMNLCLALAVHLDRRPAPIFPRWVAGFSVVTAAAMTPAVCAVVFTDGPLAWNGIVSFWLRLGAFCLYLAVMFVVVRSAISAQARES
ncbi:hypothetical protein [Mycobacterium sp. 360MFTsu5.1]|uniref:hypothetical protein n=1 Tax=Mycobacterium sp. 360MFTsu5.1 TaxID=1172186 RepID=UPI0003A52C87|nr:hypothetical protein [Mycobacterium sp. 360MFTsu5.1]